MYLQFHCLNGPPKTKAKIPMGAGSLRDSTTCWTVLWPWLQWRGMDHNEMITQLAQKGHFQWFHRPLKIILGGRGMQEKWDYSSSAQVCWTGWERFLQTWISRSRLAARIHILYEQEKKWVFWGDFIDSIQIHKFHTKSNPCFLGSFLRNFKAESSLEIN